MSTSWSTEVLKFAVAGGYGSGKTTLVTSLSDIVPVSTESGISSFGSRLESNTSAAKTTTTVAFDFGRFAVTTEVRGYLFGLPGQDRFRFLWPQLLRGSFGALVLVDPERSQEARLPLEALRRVGIPAIVLVNAFDGLIVGDLKEIERDVVRAGDEPVTVADVRDRSAVAKAVKLLIEYAEYANGTTSLACTPGSGNADHNFPATNNLSLPARQLL